MSDQPYSIPKQVRGGNFSTDVNKRKQTEMSEPVYSKPKQKRVGGFSTDVNKRKLSETSQPMYTKPKRGRAGKNIRNVGLAINTNVPKVKGPRATKAGAMTIDDLSKSAVSALNIVAGKRR